MKNKPEHFNCQRLTKVLWHYNSFHYSNWGYALLFALCLIFVVGGIHFPYIENDLILEEANYNNAQKEEVHEKIRLSIESNDFYVLNQNWKKYKNQMQIMIQDYSNFQIYYDSHEKYRFVTAKKQLEYYILERNGKKYEVSVYSLSKMSWNSVYKHWLKNFTRSFKSSSKYRYLTVWLLCIYPPILFFTVTFKAFFRVKRFVKVRNTT